MTKERYLEIVDSCAETELEITDIRDRLPKHPTKKWIKRYSTDLVVVHQAVTYNDNIENMASYHVTPSKDRDNDGVIEAWERNHISNTGCPGVCYTLAIDHSGNVFLLNKYDDMTWHCKGFNSFSLGFVVMGNYSGPSFEGKDHLNEKQMCAIIKLMDYLKEEYVLEKKDFFGHGEININKENCPGNEIMEIIEFWRKDN